jgi:hypothetical protein
MLDEQEWEQVLPHLQSGIEEIQKIRQACGTSLFEAKQRVSGVGALQRYYELTGFREANINALWHHRLAQYGPPCSSCGRLLRTPRAKFCAACGTQVEGGRKAD